MTPEMHPIFITATRRDNSGHPFFGAEIRENGHYSDVDLTYRRFDASDRTTEKKSEFQRRMGLMVFETCATEEQLDVAVASMKAEHGALPAKRSDRLRVKQTTP